MRKLSVCVTILAVLAGAFCLPATAQDLSPKEALVQRYYWYEELLASANSEDMILMQTDDFINVPLNTKELSRQQSDAMVRISADAVHRVYGANVTINSLKIHGDSAIAVVTQYFNSDNKGADGTIRRVISNMVMRHLWMRTENGWQIKRSRTLRGQFSVDGKTIRL